ncbi:hypothetical protein L1887_40528 [Cichorium endivia]|nr:hypothetical protein L1887_40528 [Cichorium endivia]
MRGVVEAAADPMRRVMRQMEETKNHIESASDALAVTAEPNTCALIHTRPSSQRTGTQPQMPNFPTRACRCFAAAAAAAAAAASPCTENPTPSRVPLRPSPSRREAARDLANFARMRCF